MQIEGNSKKFSRQNSTRSSSSTSSENIEDGKSITKIDDHIEDGVGMEVTSKATIKRSISVNYFKMGGHWSIPLTLMFSFLVAQFLASATDYWVSVW